MLIDTSSAPPSALEYSALEYQEQFITELERIELLIQQYVSLTITDTPPAIRSLLPSRQTLEENINHFLEKSGQNHNAKDLKALSSTWQLKKGSRLEHLTQCLSLNHIERDILLICLLPYVNTHYLQIFSLLNGNNAQGATEDLLIAMVTLDNDTFLQHHTVFHGDAPLQRHQLLLPVRNKGAITEYIGDKNIFYYLLGNHTSPASLTSYGSLTKYGSLTSYSSLTNCGEWLATQAAQFPLYPEVTQKLIRLINKSKQENDHFPMILLKGKKGIGRTAIVCQVTHHRPVFKLNIALLLQGNPSQYQATLQLIIREVLLHQGAIILSSFNPHPRESGITTQILNIIKGSQLPTFALVEEESALPLSTFSHIVISLPKLTAQHQKTVLHHYLQKNGVDPATIDTTTLSQRYAISVDNIEQVIQEAKAYYELQLSSPQQTYQPLLDTAALQKALKQRSQQDFCELAERIEPKRGLKDLIVNNNLEQQLREILLAIKHRDSALDHGFREKVATQTGISALFFGDSGTGKTLAAEVLAYEIGVDLIKVDLSNVVNKYIGETEKNLSRIFDLATVDSGVLFFDEADALFGKRSETKDAHDRHANIEVSYLLQRLESYAGLAILSTNHRAHIDSAFNRRLTFMTRFPRPDTEERWRMWKHIWPESITLSKEVDLRKLADKHSLTGANIRNIALLATWLAMEEPQSGCITNHHIEVAIKREFSKIGRII